MLFWLLDLSGAGFAVSTQLRERCQSAQKTDWHVPYWPQLDGFRTLSVMMVFAFHAWICSGSKPSPMGTLGYLGVDCFFALSAFLITSLLIREKEFFGSINYRQFVMRRGLRIWPLFYAVLIFTCVFLPFLNAPAALQQYPQFVVQQFVPAAFFYFNFVYPFNHQALADYSIAIGIPVIASLAPFWTLCIEEHFYAVWPLIMKRVPSLSALAIGICFAEFLTVLARCVMHWVAFNVIRVDVPFQLYYMNTFCHLDPLLIGALLAIVYHQKPKLFQCGNKFGIPLLLLLLTGLTYLLSNLYLHFPTSNPMMIFDLTVIGFTSGLMLYLVMAWNPLRKLFSTQPMAVIGRVSFAIYLFHNFILAVVEKLIVFLPLPDGQLPTFVIKCIIGFPITYALAVLSWKYLESPFLRLKKKYDKRAVNPA